MQQENRLHSELINNFKRGRVLKFDKGEIILQAKDIPQGIYLIDKGFVQVYSISDEGDENIHIIYKAGEVFPLIWAFNNITRDVFYQAISPCQLYLLSKEDFLAAVHDLHEMSNAVILQLTEQFRVFADRLENLEYGDAFERVVYRLLFLASRFGEKSRHKIIINAPITHQRIADSINLVRETVSREIEELEKQKIISHRGRKIVINDIKGLQKLVGFGYN